jgi:hypothetical protein
MSCLHAMGVHTNQRFPDVLLSCFTNGARSRTDVFACKLQRRGARTADAEVYLPRIPRMNTDEEARVNFEVSIYP